MYYSDTKLKTPQKEKKETTNHMSLASRIHQHIKEIIHHEHGINLIPGIQQ